MKTYNGHRSWNAWNVSLWLNNSEETYRNIILCMKKIGFEKTVDIFSKNLKGLKTPDGAYYNKLSIRLALQDWREQCQN